MYSATYNVYCIAQNRSALYRTAKNDPWCGNGAFCHLSFELRHIKWHFMSIKQPYTVRFIYWYSSISVSLHRQSILATWNNGVESLWLYVWYQARTGRLDSILFYWSLESINSTKFGTMSVPSAFDYTWNCSEKKCIQWPLTSQLLMNRIIQKKDLVDGSFGEVFVTASQPASDLVSSITSLVFITKTIFIRLFFS